MNSLLSFVKEIWVNELSYSGAGNRTWLSCTTAKFVYRWVKKLIQDRKNFQSSSEQNVTSVLILVTTPVVKNYYLCDSIFTSFTSNQCSISWFGYALDCNYWSYKIRKRINFESIFHIYFVVSITTFPLMSFAAFIWRLPSLFHEITTRLSERIYCIQQFSVFLSFLIGQTTMMSVWLLKIKIFKMKCYRFYDLFLRKSQNVTQQNNSISVLSAFFPRYSSLFKLNKIYLEKIVKY